MRCLVTLGATRDQAYNPAYHVKLQGLVYDLLAEAGYEFVHREHPFKFVTFSNIFPPRDMSAGDERSWIVASPNKQLIQEVAATLHRGRTLEVGERRYRVRRTSVFEITPEEYGTMETGTPVVVRIPAGRCQRYGIENADNHDDVYWRLDHPREAFVREVERNLAAKFREYYDQTPPDGPYFTGLNPKKQVAVPLHYEDQDVQVIGTTWELSFNCRTRPMYRLIKLAYATGLGEMNTTGFGFVNESSD
jgi:CRISPR-associated endoribonuclease Cas6